MNWLPASTALKVFASGLSFEQLAYSGERRRSDRYRMDKLLPKSVIKRPWPFCSVAVCAATSLRN